MNLKSNRTLLHALLCTGTAWLAATVHSDQRLFTYTYEPETLPKGAMEFEQWVTARVGRTANVGKDDYYRFQFREEFEYGVTDNYTASLYLNTDYEHYVNPATGARKSHYRWTGISIENKYLVLNPAEHAVGLALYLEPTYDGENAELEQKLIFGQRHGDWKWALNLTHATEWEDHFRETEGEFEVTLGVSRALSAHWFLGVEARNSNHLPEYETWEDTALYIGPAVSYQRGSFWATLTAMPQVFGANFDGDPDGHDHLDLAGHERWNIRLIAGYSF